MLVWNKGNKYMLKKTYVTYENTCLQHVWKVQILEISVFFVLFFSSSEAL